MQAETLRYAAVRPTSKAPITWPTETAPVQSDEADQLPITEASPDPRQPQPLLGVLSTCPPLPPSTSICSWPLSTPPTRMNSSHRHDGGIHTSVRTAPGLCRSLSGTTLHVLRTEAEGTYSQTMAVPQARSQRVGAMADEALARRR